MSVYQVGLSPVVVPVDAYSTGESVENLGPDTLYYRAGTTVSAGQNDGTLASGRTLTISTSTAFVAQTSAASLEVTPAGGQPADARYAPQIPGLVAPAPPNFINSYTTTAGSTLYFARVVVPRSGILHDFAIPLGATSGNVIGVVYDTGDASAGNRTRLWTSGSVACGTANSWQVVGDPALAVTAGQQLDLAFIFDNALASIGRVSALANQTVSQLPANFWPAPGGALPKLLGQYAPGSFTAPATIAEANVGQLNTAMFMMARVA